jgi:hypothetical protein
MKTPANRKLPKKIIMRCMRCNAKLTKTNCMFIAYNPKIKNSNVGCCYKCVGNGNLDYLKLKPYDFNESYKRLPEK